MLVLFFLKKLLKKRPNSQAVYFTLMNQTTNEVFRIENAFLSELCKQNTYKSTKLHKAI